jgi:indolepyruvate decarboxylase
MGHVFGIPGDYVLAFAKMLEESPIRLVGTSTELAAGFAADAYARVKGLGVACVTYGVGGLNLVNAAACAYAEKSPLVVISGAPGVSERKAHAHLHHTIHGYATQREVFEKLTVATCCLQDPCTAAREMDRVLAACLRHKRPVYIEIPRDTVAQFTDAPYATIAAKPHIDLQALSDAVADADALHGRSRQPVILAGMEIQRRGLQDRLLTLATRQSIPLAAMLLSKSVVPETHPLYAGIYAAAMGRPEVTRFVESSDCVLALGAILDDIGTGIFTHQLDESQMILATSEAIRVRHYTYRGILLEDFLEALCQEELTFVPRPLPQWCDPMYAPWEPQVDAPITIRRLFQKINSVLDDHTMVLADTGDSMFAAMDLKTHKQTGFLCPAFYTTMGFSVPASIGVQCADPSVRPLVLVGDGAFQMSATDLGTSARCRLNPIVIVLNNRGYGTERFLLEGNFNDIPSWEYHRLPALLGAGCGFEVHNETDLEIAMQAALANRASFSVLNVHLAQGDTSPALRRLAQRLAQRV